VQLYTLQYRRQEARRIRDAIRLLMRN